MTSEKRILAARANGAKSRGPKTPEGKARSSQNAIRHGLLAKCVLLEGESPEGFQETFHQYIERFAPVDNVEMGLIEEMVGAYWRLRRAMTIETHMMDSDMDARHSGNQLDRLVASFNDLSPKLNLLYRYQTRLHLMHSRLLRDLALMRQKLPPAEPNEPTEPSASAGPELWDSASACPGEQSSPVEPNEPAGPNEPTTPAPEAIQGIRPVGSVTQVSLGTPQNNSQAVLDIRYDMRRPVA